jgi:hypothetical protein
VSAPSVVDDWPDWYLSSVVRALAELVELGVDDDVIFAAWRGYCVAAPAAEVDA